MDDPKEEERGWRAAPQDLAQSFNALTSGLPEVEMRRMFGCTCALVHGYMFAGLHEQGVFLKLAGADRERIEAQLDARPFEPLPGRTSRSYVMVPSELLAQPEDLVPWLEKARDVAASLPQKPPKKPRKPGR